MIKLEKVNKYFYRHKRNQIHVIDNTSLEFGDSGLVALLGPSGCGKTTLLNAIGGLDRVNKGKIFINGKMITKRTSGYIDKIRNLNIGYIFQDYCLVDNMTVFDNIALSLKICGIKNKEEIKKRVYYVLEKVNMYRYRNKFASMLSGGERQRVGIARAIVKDPRIIIADEPTGNLDSRNSLEVMNIIKAISKDRLVILVTHETDLAEFYANRIITISDGKIISDKENTDINELDYRLDSNIYLKDFETHNSLTKDNVTIDYYSNTKDKLDIDIVVQNNNIYIKTKSKEKVEIVDDSSSIEFVDDHYKKISKTIYEEYDFNFKEVINEKYKKRYSSIFNPFTLLKNGFIKVRDYSIPKKLLLAGFFAAALTIMMLTSNVLGVTNVKDESFIEFNRNYLSISAEKLDVNKYLEYEKKDNVKYMIPGSSLVSFNMPNNEYYQTKEYSATLKGSLSSLEMITKDDIIYGNYPSNDYEIVVDKFSLNKLFEDSVIKMCGIKSIKDLIGKKLNIDKLPEFTLVGVVDKKDPSIYVSPSIMNYILYYSQNSDGYMDKEMGGNTSNLLPFNLVSNKINIEKGSSPQGDYEVLIHNSQKDSYKIGKTIDNKVNGVNLKVIGYYTSSTIFDSLIVSDNTLKYDLINNSKNITLYSTDREKTISDFKKMDVNINDSYQKSKNNYKRSTRETVISCLVYSGVALFISLIEIYLMMRSSFLSRIKEVGIYRAIGMKKKDIRKLFLGEIIAITTIACLPAIAFMTYCISQMIKLSWFKNDYMLNPFIVGGVIIFMYLFNTFIGLLPVNRTLHQTPAKILSRTDI